jgi:hypothetical protein
VVPKHELKPSLITLDNLTENEHRRETIKILSNYEEDFEIESTSSEKKTIQMIEYKKVEDGYEMIIEIIPQKNKNRVVDTFYVNIKDGKQLALKFIGYYIN